MKNYYVYILKCKDDSYYTGVTNDINRRLNEHNNGMNANSYTYNRRPVILMFSKEFNCILQAIEFERTQHVLHEMKSLGADVQRDGQQLTHTDINLLDVKTAHDVNIETRDRYSATEIKTMYRPQIKIMEDMWKEVGKNFNLANSPFKMTQTYMKVLGVDPDLIINGRSKKTFTS